MPIESVERIPLRVFEGVNATLFALALITAATRTVIQFRSQRRLHPDDFILMFACAALIGSQVLLYVHKIDVIYYQASRVIDPITQNILFSSSSSVVDNDGNDAIAKGIHRRAAKLQLILFPSLALSWTCIYAVKISFLLFFYQLITRLRRWILAWKIIFAITIVFWAFCASAVFIGCPKFTTLACTAFSRNLALAIVRIILDITSDLLIISIPFILLWKVKIKRQQKILLGIFLCLSVCMIIIAIIRISGLRIETAILDIVWELFWQQTEAAIAVIMVSITAFRSLLGIKAHKTREKMTTQRFWNLSHHHHHHHHHHHRDYPKVQAGYFKKTKTTRTNDESEFEPLPSIPGANFTGIRTFICGETILSNKPSTRGGGTGVDVGVHNKSEEKDLVGSGAHADHEPHEIKVTHQFSIESEILNTRPKPASTTNFV